jgi:hypothetical protein
MYKVYEDNGRLYAVTVRQYKNADGSTEDVPCSFPLIGNVEGLEVGRIYDFMDFQLIQRRFCQNGRKHSEFCMYVLSWKEA